MYVRWKRYARKPETRGWGKNRTVTPQWLIVATLVESKRIDGKVKQTQLAYLGSIREDRIQAVANRMWFHGDAERALASAVADDADRERLWQSVLARVPIPTDAERAQDREEDLARRLRLVGLLAMANPEAARRELEEYERLKAAA